MRTRCRSGPVTDQTGDDQADGGQDDDGPDAAIRPAAAKPTEVRPMKVTRRRVRPMEVETTEVRLMKADGIRAMEVETTRSGRCDQADGRRARRRSGPGRPAGAAPARTGRPQRGRALVGRRRTRAHPEHGTARRHPAPAVRCPESHAGPRPVLAEEILAADKPREPLGVPSPRIAAPSVIRRIRYVNTPADTLPAMTDLQ
jgi:hypothetical protein